MKRFINFLAALALIVSMQGCSGDPATEPELPPNPDSPTQASVQLRLKGDIAAIKPASRVGASGFEADDKVGVYVSATGSLSTSSNMLDNEAFTYSSGNITAPEGKEVYWGTPDVCLSVWAYYPYAESVSNNAAYPFAVAVDQSKPEGFYNSDFILAKATNLEPQAEAVNLTFNHSLSKIFITLEAGEGISAEDLAEAEKSFSIKGLVTDGTIDLATGTATAGTTTATITPLESEDVNYAAIVYPQQGAVTFRMEMDGDIYTYATNVDFKAALQYDYTLTINVREPQEMSLKTTTITPWGAGGNHPGTMTDIITFADPKFKSYLQTATIYEFQADPSFTDTAGRILGGKYINSGRKIDANNDGEISIAEAEAVLYIDVKELGVTNLSGIEYFENLEVLICSQTPHYYNGVEYTQSGVYISSLDISKNKKLRYLDCGYNYVADVDPEQPSNQWQEQGLSKLDLTANSELLILLCDHNTISEIVFPENSKLTYLSCGSNKLTTLDVSNLSKLESLICTGNSLTSLDVSKLSELKVLNCGMNKLSSLNVSNNLKLTELACWTNELATLDLSKCTELQWVQCQGNNLTAIDVTKNTKLEMIWCGEQDITSLDVSKNTLLTELVCWQSKLTSIDVSNNTLLESLGCDGNQLEELDVSANTELQYLACTANRLQSLDVSNNLKLESLYCGWMENADNHIYYLPTLYMATGQAINRLDIYTEETEIIYK